MADWSKSMQQTFEYYEVDPNTWMDKRKISNVKSCTITRDSDAETLGSASFTTEESLGECYIRVYLSVIQNGVEERFPLGTYLVQTPKFQFNGTSRSSELTAYTPLIELKENQPPLGYSILGDENANIMDRAYMGMGLRMRAPITKTHCDEELTRDFVSNTEDTWLTFYRDLIAKAKYHFGLDEYGQVIFEPAQDLETLQPVVTYDDGNSSILLPEINLTRDLYGVPNQVRVIYSTTGEYLESVATNDDPNNVVSTVSRGRVIEYREVNPSGLGDPTQMQLDEYAKRLLKSKSTIKCSITYKHGFNNVRLGDCVRLNYERAGIMDVKAQVTQQSIECKPGCIVSETAIFTSRFWGGDL